MKPVANASDLALAGREAALAALVVGDPAVDRGEDVVVGERRAVVDVQLGDVRREAGRVLRVEVPLVRAGGVARRGADLDLVPGHVGQAVGVLEGDEVLARLREIALGDDRDVLAGAGRGRRRVVEVGELLRPVGRRRPQRGQLVVAHAAEVREPEHGVRARADPPRERRRPAGSEEALAARAIGAQSGAERARHVGRGAGDADEQPVRRDRGDAHVLRAGPGADDRDGRLRRREAAVERAGLQPAAAGRGGLQRGGMARREAERDGHVRALQRAGAGRALEPHGAEAGGRRRRARGDDQAGGHHRDNCSECSGSQRLVLPSGASPDARMPPVGLPGAGFRNTTARCVG